MFNLQTVNSKLVEVYKENRAVALLQVTPNGQSKRRWSWMDLKSGTISDKKHINKLSAYDDWKEFYIKNVQEN